MSPVAELLVKEGDVEGVSGGRLAAGLLEGVEVGIERGLELVEGAEFACEVFMRGSVVGEEFEIGLVLEDGVGVVAGGGVKPGGVNEEGAASGVGLGGLGEEGGGLGEIAGVGLGGGEVLDDVVAARVGVVEGVERSDGGADLAVGELAVGGVKRGGDLGVTRAGGGGGVVLLAASEEESRGNQGEEEAGKKGGLPIGGQRGFDSRDRVHRARAGGP